MTINFSLTKSYKTKPHLLADTAELALCFGEDRLDNLSEASLITILRLDNETADQKSKSKSVSSHSDGDDGTSITGREQEQIEECFRVIETRQKTYGDIYPFILNEDKALSLKPELSKEHKLYLFLLICSRTGTLPMKYRNILAAEFEEICKDVLLKLMPENSEVYLFGVGSEGRKVHFHTDLKKALPILAQKANFQMLSDWEDNVGSSGDAKVDLIGIRSFDDNIAPSIVYLGQCASRTEDWEKKRFEAVFSNYLGTIMSSFIDPVPVFFVPVCFRQANNKWVKKMDVQNSLVIDRQRILKEIIAQEVHQPFIDRVDELLSSTV